MTTYKFALFPTILLGLSACGEPGTSVGLDGEGEVTSVVELPGTENPTAGGSIIRLHERDEDADYALNAAVTVQDSGATIIVEGMPFDGDADRYTRTGTIGDFDLFENADKVSFDPVGGDPIDQLDYFALHQESANGLTYITIVASAAADRHDLHGFVYGRTGGVTLPTVDQANYTGTYAGFRRFETTGGIEQISADMEISIDFENLGSPGAFGFAITNRIATDSDGNSFGLPSFGGFAENFALDAQGEFNAEGETGQVDSASYDAVRDEWTTTENGISAGSGEITGMIAGPSAQTVVGTLVLDGGDYIINTVRLDADNLPDPTGDLYYIEDTDLTGEVNETGGFILNR